MSRVADSVNTVTYEAQIPSQPSQSLVRFNVRLKRTDVCDGYAALFNGTAAV
jgi:hypothetical protein